MQVCQPHVDSYAPLAARWHSAVRHNGAAWGRVTPVARLICCCDKFPAFPAPRFETNPNLGVRGLRFSLVGAEKLFRTQIEATLQVSCDYDLKILLPMVLGGSGMRDALTLIRQIAQQQGVKKLPLIGAWSKRLRPFSR